MALARPTVSVFDANSYQKCGDVQMPDVMQVPIRPDLVNRVYSLMWLNQRQAHGVKPEAGYGYSAESWGTGRAVSRIPRVAGGGTHRSGQAAFGNMCRGGGMYSPIKTWRKWHHKIPQQQRRQAAASAIAATGYVGLVMGKGHKIDDVPELPLIVSDAAQSFTKTKEAVALLSGLGVKTDLDRVRDTIGTRPGKGKMRGRRRRMRKGPLIVYSKNEGIWQAFRNIPGVDVQPVDRLSVMDLAPGGMPGRLTIWTESAFKWLQEGWAQKSGFHLQRPLMTNADLGRIINSTEIQSVLRPAQTADRKSVV